jgi:hypothetical protein
MSGTDSNLTISVVNPAAGSESLRTTEAGLEERGIPAARGGKWSPVQVVRLLGAADNPFRRKRRQRRKRRVRGKRK